MSQEDLSSLLPLGTGAFHVLLILAEGENHGYSIGKKLETATGLFGTSRPGKLYGLLKQMLADGWITEVDGPESGDPRRRYYRLSPWGRRVAQAEAKRLEQLVQIARTTKLLPRLASA